MAQHEASGKHSTNGSTPDQSSQETKKMDRAAAADETKEMPKASARSASSAKTDTADKTVKFHSADEQKTVKPVDLGPAKSENEGGSKRTAIIVAVVAIVIIIAAIIGFMMMNSNQGTTSAPEEMDIVDVAAEPVDNPVDFAALQAQNPDVYAYINIPDTNIDLPILFNAEQDNYYLTHDIDGNSTIVGAIYSQSMNTQDFTDPVTVLYGHTLLNGTMFSELHKFEDPEFFESHPYFNVYLPDKILNYEVLAVTEYDDKHIMNTYDFTNEEVVQEFFDSMQYTEDPISHVREGDELKAGTDNILVLSTCTQPSNDSKRFLLVGKLLSSQPTK